MFHRAYELFRQLRSGVTTTAHVVANLAEAAGVPTSVASILRRRNGRGSQPVDQHPAGSGWPASGPAADFEVPSAGFGVAPVAPQDAGSPQSPLGQSGRGKPGGTVGGGPGGLARQRRRTGRRSVVGGQAHPNGVRPLQPEDAIGSSTYLARIVWALGVAELEGLGPQRPADIARMVMARSAVSLEPPNVARYIRRSHPTCISVDRVEGSSSFYTLNEEGTRLFQEHFRGAGLA